MTRLLRFYAARRVLALLACWVLAWLTLQLFGGPPNYFNEWPSQARSTLASLVDGTLKVSFIAWLYFLLKPWVWGSGVSCTVSRVVLGFALIEGLQGGFQLLTGIFTLPSVEPNGLTPVFWNWLRVAGLPLLFGSVPLGYLELREFSRSNDNLHRWWNDGQGHVAGWASLHKIRKLAQPLLRSAVVGGYYGCGVILGKVKLEDTYESNLMAVHESTPHIVTIAQPGGGKHIGAMPTYCTYRGSLIALSNKPEIVDQVLGGRVAPDLLPHQSRGPAAGVFGVDPRGLTKTKCHLANSKSYLLDFGSQSVYPSNSHPLLSEIDVDDDNAQVLALAIADGSHPENSNVSSDPWFREGPRNAEAAGILHFLSTEADPRKKTLPYIIERLMGVDRYGGESGPKAINTLLLKMVNNRHPVVGGFVATTAAQILELGDRSYGCLKSGIQTHCSWSLAPHLRKQLTGPADFSYRDVGIDGAPVSVFIVLPRGDAAMRNALPLMRAHAELALQILQTKTNRPEIPTLFVADEGRQYLQGVQSIAKSPTLLRDARVKLWTMFQSWPSVIQTIGESGATELEACSTMQYFAINDQQTAEKIARRLGRFVACQRKNLWSSRQASICDVKTPAEVLRELSITSPLSYVMGGGLPPLRLERLAFKSLVTREGARYQGLPLAGQYDEGLSRYTYGGQAM